MSLEHLVLLKQNKTNKNQQKECLHNDGVCQRGTGTNCKSSQSPKLEQFEEGNKVALYDNPKYKIKICESILIEINE